MLIVSNENKTVNFNGEVYPESGWCVILAGGTGCGQSAISDDLIPFEAEVCSYDDLQLFVEKKREAEDESFVPNVIFDLTGSNQAKITNKARKAKKLGYKVSLVYVLHTIEWQLRGNATRDRKVPSDVLKSITREVYDTLREFVNDSDARDTVKDLIDEVWAITVFDGDFNALPKTLVKDKAKGNNHMSDYKRQTVVYKLKGMDDDVINLDVKSINSATGEVLSDMNLNDFIQSQYDKIPVEETTLRYQANYYYGDD